MSTSIVRHKQIDSTCNSVDIKQRTDYQDVRVKCITLKRKDCEIAESDIINKLYDETIKARAKIRAKWIAQKMNNLNL